MEMKSNYNNIFCVISFFSALRAFTSMSLLRTFAGKRGIVLLTFLSSIAGLNKMVEEFLRISARAGSPQTIEMHTNSDHSGGGKHLCQFFSPSRTILFIFASEVETFICHEI